MSQQQYLSTNTDDPLKWICKVSHREHVLFMPKCNVNLPLIMLSVGFAEDFYIGHKISISIWSAFIKSHELICRKLWQDKDQIKFMIQGDSNKSDGSTETFANKQRASIEMHICHLSMDHMYCLKHSSPSTCWFVRTYAIPFNFYKLNAFNEFDIWHWWQKHFCKNYFTTIWRT